MAAGRAAAGARLEADVVHAARDLARAAGEGDPHGIDKDASERLTAGLARAAGIAWLCQQGEALNSVQPGEPIALDMRHQRLIRH